MQLAEFCKYVTRIPESESITVINFVSHEQLRPVLASVSIIRTITLGKGSSPVGIVSLRDKSLGCTCSSSCN